MTIQPGRSQTFGSPPPAKCPGQVWTPQPMRKLNGIKNNNGNGGVVGRGGGNKNTVLQFWQSQEMRSGNNIAKAFLL